MEKLTTSLTIIRHSLGVMRRHPVLLAFPLISLAVALVVYVFFLAPLLFDTSMAEIWYTLSSPDEHWDAIAPWHAGETAPLLWRLHFIGYAGYYLFAMFITTFANVALYSQIIEAMSGGRVSVARGFAVACGRLRAILVWTALASTVGLLLRALQERVGPIGKWVAGLARISWSAASVFVIPVIINEPRPRNPFDYIRISTGLAKRVWGEGILGIGSFTLVTMLLFFLMGVALVAAASTFGDHLVEFATVLSVAGAVVAMVMYLAWQIFECSMYVYATEGVAPGTFNETDFDRVWIVRKATPVGEKTPVVRQIPWKKLWLAIPAVLFGLSFWLPRFAGHATYVEHPESDVGGVQIDLEKLGYRLGMADLRAAGMFAEGEDPGTEIFAGRSRDERFTGKPVEGLQAEMFNNKNTLWIYFYGQDAAGKQRLASMVQTLKRRFPEHEGAIILQPQHDANYTPRTTRISWGSVRGATSYALEIDCFDCCREGKWCSDVRDTWKIVTGLKTTSYSFDWVGAQAGRVRIWGVNADGRKGRKSPWTQFYYNW